MLYMVDEGKLRFLGPWTTRPLVVVIHQSRQGTAFLQAWFRV